MSKECPTCSCRTYFCSDVSDERNQEIADLREVLRAFLIVSRERADDYIFGDTGYYYWQEKAWHLLGGKCD